MTAAPSDKPTVRAYQAEDRDSIVSMLADRDPCRRLGYTESDWQALLTPPLRGREGWVLERAGEAAGVALLRLQFLRGDYLELFAIAPGCERQRSDVCFSPRSSTRSSRVRATFSSAFLTSTTLRDASMPEATISKSARSAIC